MMYELIRLGARADFDRNCGPRPDWDTFFMEVAFAYSGRGNCTRRKVGAVISKDNQLIKAGYNGAPPGEPGCLTDGACPRGKHYASYKGHHDEWGVTEYCACGKTWPCPDSAVPGKGLYTDCTAVHAEANAIIRAGYDKCVGATMTVTEEPCWNCSLWIRAARIVRVVIP